MSPPPILSDLGALVRRHDPDRFLTALFAPQPQRESLFLLYAFNHELARAREVVSEPILALIRLQWWREVLEGERRRHEVAGPLGAALDAGLLDAAQLGAMVEGREIETEPGIADLAAWRAHLLATAGGLAAASGRILGADAPSQARLRALGAAYGAAGQLRSVPAMARPGRCLLPEDVLGAHGLTRHAVIAAPDDPALAPVLRQLGGEAQAWLREGAGRLPRPVVAAALPAVLARRDLRRLGTRLAPRGTGDRLAVMLAAATGRV
jgi:15-cis-phytoene synthase